MTPEQRVRDERQRKILAWAVRTFGGIEGLDTASVEERLRRFVEEAAELAQSLGMDRAEWGKLGHYVYDRPPGDAEQEIGGVMVTLDGLAEVLGVSVCTAEVAEFNRVQSKSRTYFEARHRAKMEVGI